MIEKKNYVRFVFLLVKILMSFSLITNYLEKNYKRRGKFFFESYLSLLHAILESFEKKCITNCYKGIQVDKHHRTGRN